jgi:alkylation response protein AidB-like acyl-CoA dehydrogenase
VTDPNVPDPHVVDPHRDTLDVYEQVGDAITLLSGDDFVVVADERLAKDVAQQREAKVREAKLVKQAGRMEDIMAQMGKGEGQMEASMVKAYVCKAAEWVTREAMQIHGGFGYAEEYSVSRLFVDARVLSIFEGADETLCLKVIARRLVEESNAK